MTTESTVEPLSFEVVRDLEELRVGPRARAYAHFVDGLTGFDPLAYSVGWLEATEPAFTRSGESPFFVMVWRGGELAGVAPFLLESPGFGPVRYRRLRFWGMGGRYLEYRTSGPVALPGSETEVEGAVIAALEGELSRDFDEISLLRVEPGEAFITRLLSSFRVARSEDDGHELHLFHGREHIDEKLSKKYLKRFAKAEEKLRSAFSSFEMTALSRIDDEVLGEVRALHIRRQHELMARGRPRLSPFEDPVEGEVLKSMIRVAEERGALRLYVQRVDGRLTNFWICFASNRYVVAEIMASEKIPGHSDASSCMLHFILREEIEKHGTEWFDFGWGTHHQKRLFSNVFAPLRTIVVLNERRIASRLRYRALQGLRRARRILGRRDRSGQSHAGP